MLVKLNPDDEHVERLKAATGARTASKAYEIAGRQYVGMLESIAFCEHQLEELMLERDVLLQVIADARNAAVALVERTSQKDLFVN